MFKGIFALAALLFVSATASANDSGLAVVNVLGIAPTQRNASVDIYGGDTQDLYNMLPRTSVGDWKNVAFASGAWAIKIDCNKEYQRPAGNREMRADYFCSISVKTREAAGVNSTDSDVNIIDADSISTFRGDRTDVNVLGIDPKTTRIGEIASFYGKDLGIFAEAMPLGRLTFKSRLHTVKLACERAYIRPTTGEDRMDHKCVLYLVR